MVARTRAPRPGAPAGSAPFPAGLPAAPTTVTLTDVTPAGTGYAVWPSAVMVVVGGSGAALTDVSPVVTWTPPRMTIADTAVKARCLKDPRSCLEVVTIRGLRGRYDKVFSKAC
jgi:hypothetical protein